MGFNSGFKGLMIEIKKQKTCTDRDDNTSGQEWHSKEAQKKLKQKSFVYRDTSNVEHEIYNYANNSWSNRNIKKGLKKRFEAMPEKAFNRFTTKDSCTWNITLMRKVLQCETWSPSSVDHRWFRRRSTGEKRLITRHNENNSVHFNSVGIY